MNISFEHHLIIFLSLCLIDIVLYRIFKKNIIFSIKFFFLIIIVFLSLFEINHLTLNLLIFYFLFTIFYILVFKGIKNTSPSLFIIHYIINNYLSSKSNIKFHFLKQNFTKKRIEENTKNKIFKKKGKNFSVSKKGKMYINIFTTIKRIYNL